MGAPVRWKWDTDGKREFEEAWKGSGAAGASLAAEVMSALFRFRAGAVGHATRQGPLLVLPIHSESPCCIIYVKQNPRLILGLHFLRCSYTEMPQAAYDIAQARLERF